jgi:hypothetical protein
VTAEEDRQLLAERLTRQLLAGRPGERVADVVRRILAVQAQDPRGFRLAVRARSTGLAASDVERALTDERSVVVSTLNRGTLHLVCAEDYWLLQPLTTPQLAVGSLRRLGQEGVSPDAADRGVGVMRRVLADGPLGRDALRARLAAADVPVGGQAFAHLVLLASIRGLVVRGPVIHGDHAFVLTDDWLGQAPRPLDREVALGELARRFLAGHGPASDGDLAKWAGIGVRDAQRGLQQVAAALAERPGGLVTLADLAPDDTSLPPPRLLGAFDPTLHGWQARDLVTGSHQGLVTTNGIFRPFAMVGGRAVATWTMPGGRVELSPFRRVTAGDQRALAADAERVIDFLTS